jgi:hypothetical protein
MEKSVINQIKTLLGMEIHLEQMTLENGTVIEAESFEAGEAVFIVTEDGQVPLPVGEYELPESMMLIVTEEGIISEKKAMEEEAVAEEEAVETSEVEVEASEVPSYVTKEDFEAAIGEIKSMLSETKKEEVKEEVALSSDDMPAAKAIVPNPEKESKKSFNFHSIKFGGTESRVLSKIAKIKK